MNDFLRWLEEILDVPKGTIDENTKKEDVASWDSLMQMRIVMEVDEKYNAQIPINEIAEIKSVKKLWDYVKME